MVEEEVEGTEEEEDKDTKTISARLSYEYSSSASFKYVISSDLLSAPPIADLILQYCTLLYTVSLCVSLHSTQHVEILCDSSLFDFFSFF